VRNSAADPSDVGETSIEKPNVTPARSERAEPSDGSGLGPSKTSASIAGAPPTGPGTDPETWATPGSVGPNTTGSTCMLLAPTTLQIPPGPVFPSWRSSTVIGGRSFRRVWFEIVTTACPPP